MTGVPFPAEGWSRIVPGLWQGGCEACVDGRLGPVVVRGEFDLVISLFVEPGTGPPVGVEHVVYPIPDGPLQPARARPLMELAEQAASAVRAGRRVLVRCQAGLNRSGLVTALTLVHLGHEAGDAIDLVRRGRSPEALFNADFERYVYRWAGRLRAAQLARVRELCEQVLAAAVGFPPLSEEVLAGQILDVLGRQPKPLRGS